MSFMTKVFWKTLWSDWRYVVIGVGLVLVIAIGMYSYFQMKRSWNWNVGGYESRAHDMVCEMVKKGALQAGPNYEKECK